MALLSDARWKGRHGIGRFAREVLMRLPAHQVLDSGPKPLTLKDPLWLSYRLLLARPSVFFSPGFNPPPVCRAPFVFTIHDLMQIQIPEAATPAKRLYYQLVVKPACRRAYRVLTVSEYSREEILKWTGLPEERVVNVGNGVSPAFVAEGRRWEPGFPYVLYVGNARPHKNLKRLFSAFKKLGEPDVRLVVAGARSADLTEAVMEAGLRYRVKFCEDVSDQQLAAIYRGAKLLVLPSLMEGFGLPALEAMACGTPVAVSKNSAMREVAGEAGAVFDPLDVTDIRQAMERVLGSGSVRETMRAAGIERARRFSWDDVAGKVRAVLDAAA